MIVLLDKQKLLHKLIHNKINVQFQIRSSQDSQTGSDPDVQYSTIVHNKHVAAQKKVNHTRKNILV